MKIDRLLGILTTLLRQEKCTAPELAEKFEVSRRTISRDIDALCLAGIPIVTEQGRNGGISITPGYKLDKQLLTGPELEAILAGVRGLDSVSPLPRQKNLMEKLGVSGDSSASLPGGSLLIDLASHYKSSLTEKLSLLQTAIAAGKLVSFRYFSEKGESHRTVEPYYVVFQWGDWYLFAWCTQRRAFRLFKLSRLWELQNEETAFLPREIPQDQLDFEQVWQSNYRLEALFAPEAKYRLIEEYGPECFAVQKDGRLQFSTDFTNYGNMLSWVLSFGAGAEVLAPEQLRKDLARQGKIIWEQYEKQDR